MSVLASTRTRLASAIVAGDLVRSQRVLRGRLGCSSGGERRLQDCYADRDSLLSTLADPERKEST